MIKVDSSCFCPSQQNEAINGIQSTISFGADLQSSRCDANERNTSSCYQKKTTLMEIFNSYLTNSQLSYTLNCTHFQGSNNLFQSSNVIEQKDIVDNFQTSKQNFQQKITPKKIFSPLTFNPIQKTNFIKFSQIVKEIQTKRSPQNSQKLTFKSNISPTKKRQELIKIEDRQNINPNLVHLIKQHENQNEKSSTQQFLKLQSKVQEIGATQSQTTIKRKRTIKNLSLSRKVHLLSPFKTINPQSKKNFQNSIFKENEDQNKATISGLEFSKKYKKKPLKNKNKQFGQENNKNILNQFQR